jgi:hypothetical protein
MTMKFKGNLMDKLDMMDKYSLIYLLFVNADKNNLRSDVEISLKNHLVELSNSYSLADASYAIQNQLSFLEYASDKELRKGIKNSLNSIAEMSTPKQIQRIIFHLISLSRGEVYLEKYEKEKLKLFFKLINEPFNNLDLPLSELRLLYNGRKKRIIEIV